jgi:hypothetical protein
MRGAGWTCSQIHRAPNDLCFNLAGLLFRTYTKPEILESAALSLGGKRRSATSSMRRACRARQSSSR